MYRNQFENKKTLLDFDQFLGDLNLTYGVFEGKTGLISNSVKLCFSMQICHSQVTIKNKKC